MAEQKKFIPEVRIYTPSDLNKRWFVYYYDQNGKRVKVYGRINRFKTYENRLQEIKRVKAQLQAKEITINKSMREKLYERVERKQNIQRKKTIQTYQSKLNILFSYLENDNPTIVELEQFYDHILRTRQASTYSRYVIDLKVFFREIGLEHYFANIKTESYQHTPKQYFQRHQVKALKEYISEKDPLLWLCIQFLFYCFIRPKESRSLKAGQILFDENKIMIEGSESKNGRTQYVAIPEAFKSDLEHIKKMQPSEYIFKSTKEEGKPIGINTMSTRHRTILRKLGFPKGIYSLYSWKHTGAVMAVKNGISVKDLQIQLRHHSLDQVDQYLRQLGVNDLAKLRNNFPEI